MYCSNFDSCLESHQGMLCLLTNSSFYTIATSMLPESQLQKSERIRLHHTIQITQAFQALQEHLGEEDD